MNNCQSLTTPIITDIGQGIITLNKGYADTESATTKATPSGVDQWLPFLRNGVSYYIPMYINKTS
jgi:hypothetical protein